MTTTKVLVTTLVILAIGCGRGSNQSQTATAVLPKIGDEPFPPAIVVLPGLPNVVPGPNSAAVALSSAASYAWTTLIALSWPASTEPGQRGAQNQGTTFGQPGTPTWITMRSKVEVYPGDVSATHPPHGVRLDGDNRPVNGPLYGYGDPPQYNYANGPLPPCAGQPPVASPALIVLDETTQIGNNQTFAGAATKTDPRGFNTKPQLIRYAVKMSPWLFSRAVSGRYWYDGDTSPVAQAAAAYVAALSSGQNPQTPPVDYSPRLPQGDLQAGIEIKSAWRPLSPVEMSSGRFLTSTVRYYEQPDGGSCYREATWGLVGMHVISFAQFAPWVVWSTFEQADNILTEDGRRTEDENGNRLVQVASPTTPALSSNPNVLNPTVTRTGDYCVNPGSRLHFRENPGYGTLPSDGDICVDGRWTPPEPIFIKANIEAHKAIGDYLKKNGGSSPLMFYKLVGAQGVPVDIDKVADGVFSTPTSYHSANMTIETDYSLANFTGNLVNGVPSNVQLGPDGESVPYVNTRLLPFQSRGLDLTSKRMGGCAGCHGFAAQAGQDFSFALRNNVTAPENTDAFSAPNPRRTYFPAR